MESGFAAAWLLGVNFLLLLLLLLLLLHLLLLVLHLVLLFAAESSLLR